ncbi:phosphoribosylaminoimidazolesuccinocarboxamide synthase [Sediminispirochaeta bajacaliforniensis]|uniref:phosphoribosylaminoimidazolesuccinocarboxamide synthase n=1 Tax=Sediminispirochaeta bajacaliforniensis TaxID=148 RepID=UPI000369D004|nr:phosphoribosylaminoimidazolesuccinocarboxamide synthase [Sediminispirochaeta bajacaliforniensis]
MKGKLLYEGKAKKLYATDDAEVVLVEYKDDATAFNGEKKGTITGKGEMNNAITTLLFTLLAKNGVENHFIEKISPREQLCRKVEIVPVEVIVRNKAAGSMAKRLGLKEGTELKTTVFEISYKNDDLGDPLINDHHAVAIGLTTFDELKAIYNMAAKVNEVLSAFFLKIGITLIDFKLEFGKTSDGKLLLADEISPDTCRFWDAATGKKLDKDRFRRDLGSVEDAYHEVLSRMENAGE